MRDVESALERGVGASESRGVSDARTDPRGAVDRRDQARRSRRGQSAEKSMSAQTSFANGIKPLFRPIDIEHMKRSGVVLDDYAYMSDPTDEHANAQSVHDRLTGEKGSRMPPGGPFWTAEQIALFEKWMSEGYAP